ncbi:hypothetical protein Bpfe_012329 [Biomphalaria pfeifferi]|uniref:Uncharacterized protein n=1 Tax=Biomphalaria pfeifferi TaxID=112525 RepID=A0AAD8BQE2_BIOPF|nr:hypothetical protein Bpfe_012329 [Biomphalaria pfeifferi]
MKTSCLSMKMSWLIYEDVACLRRRNMACLRGCVAMCHGQAIDCKAAMIPAVREIQTTLRTDKSGSSTTRVFHLRP